MNSERNPKVQQLFKAVTDLIEEGMDVHTMKVIDITNKAGIGKGTAYEYFKSKEELVSAAIAADMKDQFDLLKNMLAEEKTFEGKIIAVFHWMDQNMKRRRSAPQFFKFLGQSYEVAAGIRREFQQSSDDNICFFRGLLDDICRQGNTEGCIRDGLTGDQISVTLVSIFVAYFLYLNGKEEEESVAADQMQVFLYQNLKKCLE